MIVVTGTARVECDLGQDGLAASAYVLCPPTVVVRISEQVGPKRKRDGEREEKRELS